MATDHTPRNPRTRAEWRVAVNMAQACLVLDSARQYGLVTGGPTINLDRCQSILQQGVARRIRPTDADVDAILILIADQTGWESETDRGKNGS